MKRIYYFIVVTFMHIRNWMMSHSSKWRAKRDMERAAMFGMEIGRLYRKCDQGEIGVDFVKGLYTMSTKEYQEHICRGAYTEPVELKAHLYFANIRQWINIRRMEIDRIPEYANLSPLTPNDPILFGVADDAGKLYLVGEETRNHFEIKPYTPNESNTKSASAT